MRTGEIMALRWDEIDLEKKTAHICRIVVENQVVERTKTKYTRTVMLNSRAMSALERAREISHYRSRQKRRVSTGSPFVFRHTYATMCLMSGMNPAFIAGQLGHSVQVLLSTYAKWLSSANDWSELEKLEMQLIGTELVQD